METTIKRLSSLRYLTRPLVLTASGMILLSFGFTFFEIAVKQTTELPMIFYNLTLPFLSHWTRGAALSIAGLAVLAAGIWQFNNLAVISVSANPGNEGEIVLGYQHAVRQPRVTVISGGAGLLILASMGRATRRLTCITPVQDPVEYYYRASSLYNIENVIFVPPLPIPGQVEVELDDDTRYNIRDNLSHDPQLAQRHVVSSFLVNWPPGNDTPARSAIFKQVLDAINQADVIVLGPGSLFESILPNLLIPELSAAVRQSKARTIYICNLMTEPGLTNGFSVAAHIRQIVRYGDFAPDYVLVNARHIDSDVRRVYEAAHQQPIYLNPEEYEETIVGKAAHGSTRDVIVEGSVVIECDLASSVLQLTTSLDHPREERIVRVLRHDPEKLAAAILEIVRRG